MMSAAHFGMGAADEDLVSSKPGFGDGDLDELRLSFPHHPAQLALRIRHHHQG